MRAWSVSVPGKSAPAAPDATAEVRLSRPLPVGLLRRSEVAKHDQQYHVIDYLQRSADQ